MRELSSPSERPATPEETFRLYIDESGDHVFNRMEDASHRFLCLLGCWFRGRDLRLFHQDLERFKQAHIPHNPDEPVILHREDIINRRKAFWRLRDPEAAARFDAALLDVISTAEFRVVAVVIDKLALKQLYPVPAHPYHLAIGFLLQRYCGYLNHVNRRGDVLAESRGGHEDRLLKDSYSRVYERGVWMNNAEFFQKALTTKQLKLKPKSSNISGLQLADLLSHPLKQALLLERGLIPAPLAPFASRLASAAEMKFNRHLYQGRIEGYGKVFYPKK